MTGAEALDRAQRIVKLLYRSARDTGTDFLIQEIARELQRVAQECGWQKEKIQELEAKLKEKECQKN